MYTLIKKNNKYKCDCILELIGFKTRLNKKAVVLYNPQFVDEVIKEKFNPEFEKLIKKILTFLEEDGSSDNAGLLLDELARLNAVYLNKYEKFLSLEEKEEFMKKLQVLTNELRQIIYKTQKNIAIGKMK
jgi:hypothetical protein